ncbi:MAG: phosphotransferase family protein [Dehalococcoidia bacterium]|nr:phosphotransferase family protein [Dehalococcoidia bacterium]
MTTTDVPAGINYENVSRFFAENVEGADGPLTFKIIGDGRSNITYLVTSGDKTWVMRRPPLGHVLPTAHDMVREFRVLEGMQKAGFPAPKPLALCEDTSVNEYPFYVMDYRDGVIIVNELPEGYATTPAERRAMSLALVDTLVQLHAVDYNAVGLGEFGRPAGYLERQLRRWAEQWERSKTRELPEIDELIRKLRASLPESPAPSIVHGDYRLGNMILAHDDPGRVVAVLDWEMSTLGDPLSDVGYTLIYWGNRGDTAERLSVRPNLRVTAQEGFLTRDEIVHEYAKRSGRDVTSVDWYQVFANYKLAVIAEGIYARHLQGKTVGEGFVGYDRSAPNMVELALEMARNSSDPKLRNA